MISLRDSLSWLPLVTAAGMNAAGKIMCPSYPLATQQGKAPCFSINRRRGHFPFHRETVMFKSSHARETLELLYQSERQSLQMAGRFTACPPH